MQQMIQKRQLGRQINRKIDSNIMNRKINSKIYGQKDIERKKIDIQIDSKIARSTYMYIIYRQIAKQQDIRICIYIDRWIERQTG